MASMLSALGVQFEHINSLEDKDAAAFLESNGIAVPVIAVDDKIVVGFDEHRLREALGLTDREHLIRELPWLVDKYNLVFEAVERAVQQLDTEQLATWYGERGSTVRNHVLHIISMAEAGYLSHERGTLSIEDMGRAHQNWHWTTPEEICEYAEQVRQAITTFLGEGDSERLNRVVTSHYGGDVAVVEVVQILLRHSTHHLRQLYEFMETDLSVPPDRPLSEDDLDGIDLPTTLFMAP
jgi:uncharacterized damage-inducible protein DinB